MKKATTPISTFCVALTMIAVLLANSPAISDEAATPLVVSTVPPIQAPMISCCTSGLSVRRGTIIFANHGMR